MGRADAGIWSSITSAGPIPASLACRGSERLPPRRRPSSPAGGARLVDTILADVSSNCLHPDGRWQRSPTDARVDAALLLPVIRGVLPVGDPRNVSTIETIEKELVREDYVYRFRPDARPLGQAEGSFLLCGFLMALTKHRQGDRVTARAQFERNRSASGTSGLLAEEFDVEQRQLRETSPRRSSTLSYSNAAGCSQTTATPARCHSADPPEATNRSLEPESPQSEVPKSEATESEVPESEPVTLGTSEARHEPMGQSEERNGI